MKSEMEEARMKSHCCTPPNHHLLPEKEYAKHTQHGRGYDRPE
jgi:hypothetical protein